MLILVIIEAIDAIQRNILIAKNLSGLLLLLTSLELWWVARSRAGLSNHNLNFLSDQYRPYHRASCCSNLLCLALHRPDREKPDEERGRVENIFSSPQNLPLHSCLQMAARVKLLI